MFADDIDARGDADPARTHVHDNDDGSAVATERRNVVSNAPAKTVRLDSKRSERRDVGRSESAGCERAIFCDVGRFNRTFREDDGHKRGEERRSAALRETLLLAHELGKNIGGMGSSSKRIGIDGTFFGVDLKGDALNAENVVLVNELPRKRTSWTRCPITSPIRKVKRAKTYRKRWSVRFRRVKIGLK